MIEMENMTITELVNHLRNLDDNELHQSTFRSSYKDRKGLLIVLHHFAEVERRRMYSQYNCASLHEYAIKEMKYDGGCVSLRVSASRLLLDMPVVNEKILTGALSLTTASQASVFFRKEKAFGNALSVEEKCEVLKDIDHKSKAEVERFLMQKSDQPEIHFKEQFQAKGDGFTEATLHFDQATMNDLKRLKEIWSHANPHARFADLIKRAAGEAIEKHDPMKKVERAEKREMKKAEATLQAASQSEAKPLAVRSVKLTKAQIKRAVWKRDGGECTFVNPRTDEPCRSKHFLEGDHIIPAAMGGEYTVENIRLRCRAHNQRYAIDCYGMDKMREHLKH